MEINHDGKKYNLNIAQAIAEGSAKEIYVVKEGRLQAGDVFQGNINPFLLVQCTYGLNQYQLLGINGVSPNSSLFFEQIRTIEEVETYLIKNRMKFVRNIADLIGRELYKKA